MYVILNKKNLFLTRESKLQILIFLADVKGDILI